MTSENPMIGQFSLTENGNIWYSKIWWVRTLLAESKRDTFILRTFIHGDFLFGDTEITKRLLYMRSGASMFCDECSINIHSSSHFHYPDIGKIILGNLCFEHLQVVEIFFQSKATSISIE